MLGRRFALVSDEKGNEGMETLFFDGLAVSGCLAQKTKLKKVVNLD